MDEEEKELAKKDYHAPDDKDDLDDEVGDIEQFLRTASFDELSNLKQSLGNFGLAKNFSNN